MVSKSKDPQNPALELRFKANDGREEKYTLFANLPELNTLHRKKQEADKQDLGLAVRFVSASQGENVVQGQGSLEFAPSPSGDKLFYRSFGKDGDAKLAGVVEVGKSMPTGWMDLTFTVKEWLPNGVSMEVPRYIDYLPTGQSNFQSGIHVTAQNGEEKWLVEGVPTPFIDGNKNYHLMFGKKKLRLPFLIHLDQFSMGTDPGTDKAATYESQVQVKDVNNIPVHKALISMNEPMKYGGYTFYQASYQKEEGKPTISIFSVNFDPGRWIKYLGALVMVAGILLMFYMNPHYWDIVLGKRKIPL